MTCTDKNCATHGSISLRGRTFVGRVTSSKAHKTVTIEWERRRYLPKFERFEKARTRVKAHNPECMSAIKGEIVRIKECRPLSKTKNFIVVEKLGTDLKFMAKEETIKEDESREVIKEAKPVEAKE